jgi:hypothetical protein
VKTLHFGVFATTARACHQIFPLFLQPFIIKPPVRVPVSCNIHSRYCVIHCVLQPTNCSCILE